MEASLTTELFMKDKNTPSINIKWKYTLILYAGWILVSIFILSTKPKIVVFNFTDKPTYMNHLPQFIVTLAYLIFFLPAVILIVCYAVYVFYFIIRAYIQKNELEKKAL
jgi:hypothetical protein